MLKKTALLICASLFLNPMAYANIMFTPSVTYMDQKQETTPASTPNKAKLTIIDLRLGYTFDFGLYLGGLYSFHDQDILSDSSDNYFGPSIGYYNSGLLVALTYYLYGERDLTNGSGKYSGINGFQLDVSYSVPVSETVLIGPQLTYHSIEFDDLQFNGIASPTDYKFSGISPYFNVTILF